MSGGREAMNKMICSLLGHKLEHVCNFRDVKGGRGLWQCRRCKLVHVDAPDEFYRNRKNKAPII